MRKDRPQASRRSSRRCRSPASADARTKRVFRLPRPCRNTMARTCSGCTQRYESLTNSRSLGSTSTLCHSRQGHWMLWPSKGVVQKIPTNEAASGSCGLDHEMVQRTVFCRLPAHLNSEPSISTPRIRQAGLLPHESGWAFLGEIAGGGAVGAGAAGQGEIYREAD